jgi:uncharacterized protein YciI
MKFAAIIEYGDDKAGLKANHLAHQTYLRTFLETGQLLAAGPFADDAGVLWVLDAETAEAAEGDRQGRPARRRRCHHQLEDTPNGLLVSSEGDGLTLFYRGRPTDVAPISMKSPDAVAECYLR